MVDTVAMGYTYRLERNCYPFLRGLSVIAKAVPVLFRSVGSLQLSIEAKGLTLECGTLLPTGSKNLTPWGSRIGWPMRLSPLRDALMVARAHEG